MKVNDQFHCRGDKEREYLVKHYDIYPVLFVKLLSGQEKTSCTGQELTDKYYCFAYRKKNSGKEFKGFYAGLPFSQKLLFLLNLEPLKLSSPLKKSSGGNIKSGLKNVVLPKNNKAKNAKKHPLTQELSDAITIIIIAWDIAPSGAILSIKQKLDNWNHNPPYNSMIKAINTIISGDPQNRTLYQIVQDLKKIDNLKDYEFNLLRDKMDYLMTKDPKIKSNNY